MTQLVEDLLPELQQLSEVESDSLFGETFTRLLNRSVVESEWLGGILESAHVAWAESLEKVLPRRLEVFALAIVRVFAEEGLQHEGLDLRERAEPIACVGNV